LLFLFLFYVFIAKGMNNNNIANASSALMDGETRPELPPRKYLNEASSRSSSNIKKKTSKTIKRQRHRIKLLKKKSIWDTPALHDFLLSQNTKILHARRIYKYLLRTPNASISNLSNIIDFPVRILPELERTFSMFTSKVVSAITCKDQSTTKLLIELQDGLRIETVIIRHGAVTARSPDGEKRTTLCVSSQIGCKMGCTFCATGTMGEIGNLTSGEILEQLIFARQFAEVRNIVFMGMGEPMNNYDNVKAAVNAMIDPHRFKLSPNRVTVSTVGVPGPMKKFIHDLPNVNLALSLHAPNQDLRKSFVPSAKGFPLHKLMDTVDLYLNKTKRKLLVEYVLLNGVNDNESVANELGQLLQGKNVTINLIPYNNTDVNAPYVPTKMEDVLKFQAILFKKYKVATTVRKEMGADIASACGQLVVKADDNNNNNNGEEEEEVKRIDTNNSVETKDIEDISGVENIPKYGGTDLLLKKLSRDGRPKRNEKVVLWPGVGLGKAGIKVVNNTSNRGTGKKTDKKKSRKNTNVIEEKGKCPMRKYSSLERIMNLGLSDMLIVIGIIIFGMFVGSLNGGDGDVL
jgi:23S rRNA (adenine(2503)-C(2))-methyltransferase